MNAITTVCEVITRKMEYFIRKLTDLTRKTKEK
jgi:hypothetical protein